MRQLIRLMRMEEADRDEQETLLDLYRRAIGMDAGPGGSDQESTAFSRPPDSEG